MSPLSRAAFVSFSKRSVTEIVDVAGVSAAVGDATAKVKTGFGVCSADGVTEVTGAGESNEDESVFPTCNLLGLTKSW